MHILITDSGVGGLSVCAYAERFVRSIKEEFLNRMIFIGQASLLRVVSEYMAITARSVTIKAWRID